MSRDIESDYKEEYDNEDKRCHLCDSFERSSGQCYCKELEMDVEENGHCDFFRSID
jgi:hypothetical protein